MNSTFRAKVFCREVSAVVTTVLPKKDFRSRRRIPPLGNKSSYNNVFCVFLTALPTSDRNKIIMFSFSS